MGLWWTCRFAGAVKDCHDQSSRQIKNYIETLQICRYVVDIGRVGVNYSSSLLIF